MTNTVKVWDLPLRVFHALLPVFLIALWYLASYSADDYRYIDWHMRLGYCFIGVLIFRLLWGFIGSRYARFGSLLLHPRFMLQEFKHSQPVSTGHGGAGSWMTLIMLMLLLLQCISGLFVFDDGLYVGGPFSVWLDDDTIDWVRTIHYWNFDFITVLACAHILAILAYRVKGKNYAKAMLTGRKDRALVLPDAVAINGHYTLRFVLAFVFCSAVVVALFYYFPLS